MKTFKILALLMTAATLTACMGGDSDEELNQKLNQAAQVGQAQAIAQIIERAVAQPCQPINLFNNIDENNKKEVNLINVSCESLNLPEIPTQSAPAQPEPEPQAETETETETTE